MSELLPYRDGGAGHRGTDTAIEAAMHIQGALPRLQRHVFEVIAKAGARGATADEIADALGWVRPRTSELRRDRRIADSGQRRDSLVGVSSIVWVLPQYADRQGLPA
jgi:hypothetical protein